MKKIVWLASYPKSGNTWVRFLLANLLYPQFAPMPLNRIGALFPGEQNRAHFERIVGKPASAMTQAETHKARKKVQHHYTQQDRTMFLKTHSAFVKEKNIWHINPAYTEGAILIMRDPRDVACSMTNHFGVQHRTAAGWLNDFDRILLDNDRPSMWTRTLDWSQHYLSWTQRLGPRCCIVRYEDLKDDPCAVLKRILSFVNHSTSDEAVANAVENSSFDRLQKAEKTDGFVEQSSKNSQFFQSGRKERWKVELDPEIAQKIENDHGAVMRHLGYLDEPAELPRLDLPFTSKTEKVSLT